MKRSIKQIIGFSLCLLLLLSSMPLAVLGSQTLLEEKLSNSQTNRTLTVIAPDDWTEVNVYTWNPESFGPFPGAQLTKNGDVYRASIKNSIVHLILSAQQRPDTTRAQSGMITLQSNGKDVTIYVDDDCTHRVEYDAPTVDQYRVVGNTSLMGDWDPAFDGGLMTQITPGTYQKCFEDVAPGRYEFLITKNGLWDDYCSDNGFNYCIEVTKTCDVTVTFTLPGDVKVSAGSGVSGDVSADGVLNLGDVAKLYAHLRGSSPLAEEALGCADFNMDGKINIGDPARIYAYIRGTDPWAVVDTAYQLGENQALSADKTLTGRIMRIVEPYDSVNDCISVSIAITGREDRPILCTRLRGQNLDKIDPDDIITVTGRLSNFYGIVEFKEDCRLVELKETLTPEEEMAAIVDAAYVLPAGSRLPNEATLTGRVVSVENAYAEGVPYISVTLQVASREDKPIFCYRLVGQQISNVKTGDTITVTGTLRNYYGTIEFAEGCRLESHSGEIIPETDPVKILELAYGLKENQLMLYDVTLTGRVSEIKDAYSPEYKNISVIFSVPGCEDQPVLLYRLSGEGVERIAVNDTITVKGRLWNYNGTVEMVNGVMIGYNDFIRPPVVLTDPAEIMAAARKLSENEELPYDVTLSGSVLSIDEAYSPQYQNVTVTIAVDGTTDTLKLYRLKGDAVDQLAVDDTITVVGRIKNYYGELELDNGTMILRIPGDNRPPEVLTDPEKIVDAAYALANGSQLPYTVTLTGRIVALKTAFDPLYRNMTVVMAVSGREEKPIECYRMRGAAVGNHLCMGDTVTVTGTLTNYNGLIQFDAGCELTDWRSGSVTMPTDPKKIVDAAFALGENETLPYFATLTGTVKSIDEPYSDQYKNITLTMIVQGTDGAKDLICYRLKGEEAAYVAVGDTITVTGMIKRFFRDRDGVIEDFVEFDSGCRLESLQ